jgi:hypothetical protein
MRLIVLICCGAALLSAGGSLLLTGRYETALIAAVAMLVCAQVVALLASGKPREVEDARLASLSEGIKRNARSIEQLSTRTRDHAQALAEMKQALDQARAQKAIAAPQPRPLAAAPQLSSVAAGPALPSNQPAAPPPPPPPGSSRNSQPFIWSPLSACPRAVQPITRPACSGLLPFPAADLS